MEITLHKKSYNHKTVLNIPIRLPKVKFGIIGPNGAGKSTCIVWAGSVGGGNTRHQPFRAKIYDLFNANLLFAASVGDISYPYHSIKSKSFLVEKIILNLLTANQLATKLSGGEAKVAGKALISNP